MPVNLDKPHLWKDDVAKSVDMYNDWFMHFAPAAFRQTRVRVTGEVESALAAFRISLARRSSLTSRSSALIRSRTSGENLFD